jgi:hypothetical protein
MNRQSPTCPFRKRVDRDLLVVWSLIRYSAGHDQIDRPWDTAVRGSHAPEGVPTATFRVLFAFVVLSHPF